MRPSIYLLMVFLIPIALIVMIYRVFIPGSGLPPSVPEISPAPVQVHEYTVQISGKTFDIYFNKVLFASYVYSANGDERLLYSYENQVFETSKDVVFGVEVLPTGCEGPEDAACLKFLGKIAIEFERYGGLWAVDKKTKSFRHIFSIPQSKEYVDMDSVTQVSEGLFRVSLKFNSQQGTREEVHMVDSNSDL